MIQEFKVYTDAQPANIVTAIQADLKTNLPAKFIKQMGVVQLSNIIVVWALWEQTDIL